MVADAARDTAAVVSTMRVDARNARVLRTERERDDLVRRVPCGTCGVDVAVRCYNGVNKLGQVIFMPASHTARYLAAVEAGLVPQLAGWPWTG